MIWRSRNIELIEITTDYALSSEITWKIRDSTKITMITCDGTIATRRQLQFKQGAGRASAISGRNREPVLAEQTAHGSPLMFRVMADLDLQRLRKATLQVETGDGLQLALNRPEAARGQTNL